MKFMTVGLLSLLGGFFLNSAHADERFCTIKKMHCSGCVEMVTDRVCDEKIYGTCEGKVLDEENEIGQVHLVTKDAKKKILSKDIAEKLKGSRYTLQKCGTTDKSKKG